MPLTREDVRAAIERAGDEHWRALVAHHEDAYPASRPTPGDVARREAERLNDAGFGEGEDRVTLVHRFRDRRSGATTETPPFTNYE
jgi:hypothetical protein